MGIAGARHGVATSETGELPRQAGREDPGGSDTVEFRRPADVEPASPAQVARTESGKFRPDIEGLRAVAVGTVVAAHAGLPLTGGYIGVDVFFVISGFLITRQLYNEFGRTGRLSIAGFYARRARRILPAAAVVILATLAASWAWLSPLRLRSIAQDAIFSAVSCVNWRLAVRGTDYFQASAPPSPFQHYWSLAVEEQFYLVWPLLLVIGGVVLGRVLGRRPALLAILTVLVAGSYYLSVTVTHSSAPWGYFGSHARAWELAIGALIAITADRWSRLSGKIAAAAGWVGIAMIGFAAWWFDDRTPFPGSAAALPVVGAALVITAGCAAPVGGVEVLLRQTPMQIVGKLSYSWYLWHWPVLIVAPTALGHPLSVAEKAAAIAVSFVLAVVTFKVVEQPFRASRGLVAVPIRGIGMGLAMVAASVAIALVFSMTVGVPRHVGAETAAMSVASDANGLVDGVARSVIEAAKLRTLPANVTPSLDKALDDRPEGAKCLVEISSVALRPAQQCRFGDAAAPKTLVLFGDSHAIQWAGTVRAWAEQNHWQMWLITKSACSPGDYPNLYFENIDRTYTECVAWRAKALGFVRGLKPALVLVAGNWVPEATGRSGMANTIRTINGFGAETMFFADTPRMGAAVPDCLALHPDALQLCATPVSQAGLSEKARLAEIQGAKSAGAEVFEATPWLCTETVCPPVINNVIVYRDEGHLTNTYALTLLPQLQPVLDKLAGTR